MRDDPRGFYRFDPEFDDLRSLRNKGPYSFWAAVKYTLLLSVMLWWIPTFGQMIAGYVGGRKAGHHWKGALAAFFPVAVIWVLYLMVVTTNDYPQLLNLVALPVGGAYALGQVLPFLDPTIRFLVDYLTAFVVALRETAFMGLNGYLVTIIFAYIGGLIADQVSKERAVQASPEPEALLPPPQYEAGRAPMVAPSPRPRLTGAAGPPWYRVHSERYDHLRRIPVAPPGYPYEEEEYYEPPPRPLPRRRAERYPPEEYEEPPPRREPRHDPRREPSRDPSPGRRHLDREELIRRLVERALRDYDHAVS